MQNCTDNANGDMPLIVENVWYLISFEIKVGTCSFEKQKTKSERKRKTKRINRFLYIKMFLLSFMCAAVN